MEEKTCFVITKELTWVVISNVRFLNRIIVGKLFRREKLGQIIMEQMKNEMGWKCRENIYICKIL